MRRFLFLVIFVALSLLLSTLLPYFPLRDWRFDLLWILALYVGFSFRFFQGAFLITFLALVDESLSPPPHGFFVISFLVNFSLLSLGKKHLFFEGRRVQLGWVALLTLCRRGIETALILHKGGGTPPLWTLLPDLLIQTAGAFLLFPLFEKGLAEGRDA